MNSHQDTPIVKRDLPTIKKAVKQEFQSLPGIEGFGVGDGVINIYVSHPDVAKQLPTNFRGVPLNCINTGIIEALAALKK